MIVSVFSHNYNVLIDLADWLPLKVFWNGR